MTKKILILTADAGFGHRSAANAILAALKERYPDIIAEVVNVLDRPDAPALLKFAESDYSREVQETPQLYSMGYQVTDGSVAVGVIEQGLIALLYRPLKSLLEEVKPDAIVSTIPCTRRRWQRSLRSAGTTFPYWWWSPTSPRLT